MGVVLAEHGDVGGGRHATGKVGGQRGSRKRFIDDLINVLVCRQSLGCGHLAGHIDRQVPGLIVLARQNFAHGRCAEEILYRHFVLRILMQVVDQCAISRLIGGRKPFLIGQNDHQL